MSALARINNTGRETHQHPTLFVRIRLGFTVQESVPREITAICKKPNRNLFTNDPPPANNKKNTRSRTTSAYLSSSPASHFPRRLCRLRRFIDHTEPAPLEDACDKNARSSSISEKGKSNRNLIKIPPIVFQKRRGRARNKRDRLNTAQIEDNQSERTNHRTNERTTKGRSASKAGCAATDYGLYRGRPPSLVGK